MSVPELNTQNLVGQRVTGDPQPAPAARSVIPQLIVGAGRVVAQVDGLIETGCRIGGIGVRSLELGIPKVCEFIDVAVTTERTWNSHVASVQVGLGAAPVLIDQVPGSEAVQAIRACHRMSLVIRQQMGEAPAGGRRCLESAIAPAGIEIQAIAGRAIDYG